MTRSSFLPDLWPDLRLGSGLAVGLGTALLVAGGLLAASAFQVPDQPLPYSYKTTGAAVPEAARLLAETTEGSAVQTIELRSIGQDRLLAVGQVLNLADGNGVLVGWRSEIGEPLLRSDIVAEEEQKLVAALQKYLPPDSVVYAMPSLSRRLAALTEADYPLSAANDDATIRLPEPWHGARSAIVEAEQRWHAPIADKTADKTTNKATNKASASAVNADFAAFLTALEAEDKYGVAQLQVLAGGQESYIILHVRDAFDIGIANPDKLSVGLRDFPGASDVHDITKLVKNWVAEEGYAAYAVIQRDANAVRAYYLAEDRDKSTLIGQLLPFNSARLGLVPQMTPVFQNGGYWVYRIEAVRGT